MFSFNLIEEKWLPCLMIDNSLKNLSLREILTNASEVRELIGDSPPVTIALHRLLSAILHRALNAPQNYEQWSDFWQAKSWDEMGKLTDYLDNWIHRFDLFDEKRPFYQTSSIRENLQNGAIIQLYFQGKNNATLFDHSTTSEPKAVSPAEAARFLVTFQGFDVGGIKADGSGQTSPLLNSAIGLICGKNLFETLMLNWHCYNENDERPFHFSAQDDVPSWERNNETEAVERKPAGYVDLLTWQSRRILLQPEQNIDGEISVKNAVIMRGFQFPKGFELHNKETMTVFRKSKTEGFYSVGFNESKALWRDSFSLFQTVDGEQYRPKMLDWLNELVGEGYLNRSNIFPIEFYGLIADKAKLMAWRQERFNLPLAYLNDKELLQTLKNTVQFAEETASVLRFAVKVLAENLESNAENFSALQIYWASLETSFHQLLTKLPNDKENASFAWFGFVDKTAKRAFDETANSLNGAATEQKAIVEAESAFYKTRAKLINQNAIYRDYLPNYKTKGGS